VTRDAKLALALFVGSLLALLALSARTPLGPASSDYAALVNQAEDVVRTIARNGVASLGNATEKSPLEALGKRPLAPLLSAWAALSIARVGLLDGSTSVRLPWLVLAALMPPCIYWQLRERVGMRAALLGGLWLLASPGFASSALAVAPAALGAWAGWLVVGATARTASVRLPHERCFWWCITSGVATLGFGLCFAVVWALPLVALQGWLARGKATLLAGERGKLPVPTALVLAASCLPVGVIVFDPLLWHSSLPTMIRRVFEEKDPTLMVGAANSASLLRAALLAPIGGFALARTALARRFATGAFRPARDRSELASTVLLAGILCAFLASVYEPLSQALARPICACLVASGAAFVAERWAARHAAVAEAALVLVSVLLR